MSRSDATLRVSAVEPPLKRGTVMPVHLRASLLVAALAAILIAAEDRAEPEKKAPPKADVRGEVKKVTALRARGLVGNILVEGTKEKDTQHDKASVTLTSDTKFYRWADGKKKDAKFSDLKVGTKVQCVFTGPVAESSPVQAKASEVIILADPKK